MSLSIRNHIAGTVTAVTTGEAMATAAVTADAVEALGLAAGSSVVALIKSTDISLRTA
ncbi:TOBE domain-containing protein [Streptomyces sp. NPDC048269]|uniref:TOBE domain-containing protein n=1 Tax=Streptomyces sp. NPDC048269 TaxID=3155753 RepID=UPI003418E3A4